MPRAICEDCGSLVEAELTHNGICAVGHYVHCGWGHQLSPDDLISDDVVEIIADLEARAERLEAALVKPLDTPKAYKLKADAGIPHFPTQLTYECRMAISGKGPRAYDWTDKPHRLIYDLCREIERLAALKGDKT